MPNDKDQQVPAANSANSEDRSSPGPARPHHSMRRASQVHGAFGNVDRIQEAIRRVSEIHSAFSGVDRFEEAMRRVSQVHGAFGSVDRIQEAIRRVSEVHSAFGGVGRFEEAMRRVSQVHGAFDVDGPLRDVVRSAIKLDGTLDQVLGTRAGALLGGSGSYPWITGGRRAGQIHELLRPRASPDGTTDTEERPRHDGDSDEDAHSALSIDLGRASLVRSLSAIVDALEELLRTATNSSSRALALRIAKEGWQVWVSLFIWWAQEISSRQAQQSILTSIAEVSGRVEQLGRDQDEALLALTSRLDALAEMLRLQSSALDAGDFRIVKRTADLAINRRSRRIVYRQLHEGELVEVLSPRKRWTLIRYWDSSSGQFVEGWVRKKRLTQRRTR